MTGSIRILHVDDDPEFADLTATLLEREDDRFAVETATTGDEGLARIDAVDCVVSDYDMPSVNGIEFLETVREDHPDLPFILFTGKGNEEIASDAISAGVTDYLQKGGGTSQYVVLANRVRNAVEGYRARIERRRRRERRDDQRNALLELTTDEAVVAGDFETAVRRITETATEVLSVSRTNVWLLDGHVLRCVDHYDRSSNRHDNGAELLADDYPRYFEALETHRAIDADDARNDPRTAGLIGYLVDHDLGALLDATLRSEGEVVGVVCHEHVGGTREWTDDEIDFASDVADIVHRALRNRKYKERKRELEATRARFQALTESHAVLTIDDESIVQYANAAVEDVFGYAPEELVGESLLEIVPERFRDPHREAIDRYLREGTRQLDWDWIEMPGLHQDGREIPLGVSFGEGTIEDERCFTAIVRDITAHKEREVRLQRTTTRLEALFENSPDMITVHDGDGTLLTVNQRFCAELGYAEDELVGKRIWDVDETVDPAEARSFWAELPANDARKFEGRYRRRDGSTFPVEIHLIRLDSDGDDRFLAIIRDITERKEREREQALTIEFLQNLYDVTTDPELAFDEKIARLLESGCEKLGLPYGFLTRIEIGDTDGDGTQTIVEARGDHESLRPGESCPLSRAYCRRTIETDGPLAIQDAIEAGWEDDPAYETFEIGCYIGAKVVVDDELYGTLCFAATNPRDEAFTDTDRMLVRLVSKWASYELERHRATIDLQRTNERLEEFASVVSHDLRNPLNVAGGRLELAREECDSDHLSHVDRALDRMESLIDDLLALAREGDDAIDVEAIRLADLSEDCWETVETEGATLVTETDRVVLADRSRLRQLLENLVRNAVEHGSTSPRSRTHGDAVEHGSTSPRSSAREDTVERGSTNPQSSVRESGGVAITVGDLDDGTGFYVADDGRGIPEGERETVFETGYSTSREGTGFGLSIVERIAEAHGWEITVTESDDGGARFEIGGVEVAR